MEDMAKTATSDLDAGGTLTVLEHAVATRRSAERAVLRHVAHWADLHGDHAGVTRAHGKTDGEGGPRREHPTYRRFGGEGTPVVAEFATPSWGSASRSTRCRRVLSSLTRSICVTA